jgi:hypothetical protein
VQNQKQAQTSHEKLKKDLLPTTSKETMEVTSKMIFSSKKGRVGILFREPTHISAGKHLRGSSV